MCAWFAMHLENPPPTMPMISPQHSRRTLLKCGACLGAMGVGSPVQASLPAPAGEATAFEARTMLEALRALGAVPQPSTQVLMNLPDLIDNGAVVPISVSSSIAGTREIFIVVESNPFPLAARFTIPAGTEPFVSTRIRLAQSGTVYAAVVTDAGVYATSRSTQVTVGGCG